MNQAARALSRTALLLGADLHQGQVSDAAVVEGLLGTTVVIRASSAEVRRHAAQTTIVTLALQLAMCGIGVCLEFDDADLVAPQPPLADGGLRSLLVDHIHSTYPWVRVMAEQDTDVDMEFTIGETTPLRGSSIVVGGSDRRVYVGKAGEVPLEPFWAETPYAPIGAGIAAAAHAVREASLRTAQRNGASAPLMPGGPTRLALDIPVATPIDLGYVPVVSAGAITHATLYAVLRDPNVRALFEPFDGDALELSNYNRYALITALDLHEKKAPSLDRWSTDSISITGVPRPYVGGERESARILVGADDIPIRWAAQEDTTMWLGIGATSHLFAEVSAHVAGGACSGCVHDHEDAPVLVIPTISVVSGWAGLQLAIELVRSAAPVTRSAIQWSYPLGMNGLHGHGTAESKPNSACARRCHLSRSRVG